MKHFIPMLALFAMIVSCGRIKEKSDKSGDTLGEAVTELLERVLADKDTTLQHEDALRLLVVKDKKNGKWGLANIIQGKTLTSCIYDEIEYNGIVRIDDMFGVVDMATGAEIIPCTYPLIYQVASSYYFVQQDSMFKLFDLTGKPVFSFKYNDIKYLYSTGHWILTDTLNNEYLIDPETGEKEPYISDEYFEKHHRGYQYEIRKDGLFGVWNRLHKQWIIPPEYESIRLYRSNDGEKVWYLLSSRTQQPWGALEPYIATLEKANKIRMTATLTDSLGRPRPSQSKPAQYFGVADSTGRIVIPVACHKIDITWVKGVSSVINDYFRVQPVEDSKSGIIYAHTGLPTVPFIIDWFQSGIWEYYARTTTLDENRRIRLGVMNVCTGREVLPPEWVDAWPGVYYNRLKGSYEAFIFVEQDTKKGVMDSLGHVVLPHIYDRIDRIEGANGSSRFIVKLGKMEGLYDASGKELFPLAYDKISVIQYNIDCEQGDDLNNLSEQNTDHRIMITKNGTSTLLDYESLAPVESFTINGRLYPVREFPHIIKKAGYENLYCIVDGKGKQITDFDYERIIITGDTAQMYARQESAGQMISTLDLKTGKVTALAPYSLIFGFQYGREETISRLTDYMGFEQGGKFGCYSMKEKKITVPAQYDALKYDFTISRAIVKKNDLYGMIDMVTGQILIPFEYEKILFPDEYFP